MTDAETPDPTFAAMKNAPKGAVYIWGNNTIDHPKRLARSLKREDLLIWRRYALRHAVVTRQTFVPDPWLVESATPEERALLEIAEGPK